MSHYTNHVRLVPAGLTLAAINSGGTQIATEVDGTAVSVQRSDGLRYRKVAATVLFDQAAGTSHKFGFIGNFQYIKATSGTGSTYADFGATMNNRDNAVSGTASGVATYIYPVMTYAEIPPGALYIRLQYTPKAFIASSEALSTATGGLADISPILMLTDPNRYPADTV
jgi:hypothetical protein